MRCPFPIYRYDDYRDLLRDYYQACKKIAPRTFSYRYWARRAGFTSSNYIHLVMAGTRSLSEQGARRLAIAMQFTPRQILYFQELVRLCQATDPSLRVRALEALLAFREYRAARHLAREHFEYFSQWYYPVIRELVALPTFQPDPTWIAAQLCPTITPAQAERALHVLRQLELVAVAVDGRYVQTEKTVSTSREVRSLAVASFHRNMIRLGQASLQMPSRQREVSSLTMSLSSEEFRIVKQKIHAFHEEVLALLDRGVNGAPAHVYQLNFQFFPVVHEQEAAHVS